MWTKDRHDELELLQKLLRETSDINNGNRCLERIAKCIELAQALTEIDLRTGRQSFFQFLVEEATKELSPDTTRKDHDGR